MEFFSPLYLNGRRMGVEEEKEEEEDGGGGGVLEGQNKEKEKESKRKKRERGSGLHLFCPGTRLIQPLHVQQHHPHTHPLHPLDSVTVISLVLYVQLHSSTR